MLERPPQPSASFITQESHTRSARFMKVVQQWTGWNKSKNVGLRSPLQLRHAHGRIIESILLILQVTSISLWRLNVPFVSWMVLLLFSTVLQELNPKQKLCGDKL